MLEVDVLVFTLTLYALSHFSEILVSSSLKLSKYFKINPLIIGFFVIAMGTSLPEMFIAVSSITQNLEIISIADLFGATVINSTLIIGISLIIARRAGKEITNEYRSVLLLMTSFFVSLTLVIISPSRYLGISLILLYMIVARFMLNKNHHKSKIEEAIEMKSIVVESIKLAISLFIIIFSSRFLVVSVSNISTELGIESIVISSLIVAIGTTVPELFTAINAAGRDLRLVYANSYGSTIINLALILGIILTFSQNIEKIDLSKFWFHAFFILLSNMIVLITFDKLDWRVGVLLLGIYALYLTMSISHVQIPFMLR